MSNKSPPKQKQSGQRSTGSNELVEPRRYGQRPGSMHIDRLAGRLLADHIFEEPDDELLTTEQLAREWFDCSTQKLEKDRTRGPP